MSISSPPWWPRGKPPTTELKKLLEKSRFETAAQLAIAATEIGAKWIPTEEVSESSICRFMRGHCLGKRKLEIVAKALGCNLEEIASAKEQPNTVPPSDEPDATSDANNLDSSFGPTNKSIGNTASVQTPQGTRWLKFRYEGKDPTKAQHILESVLQMHNAQNLEIEIIEIEP